MSNAKGIDISHWDGLINWGVTYQYVDFVIIKSTEGYTFVDDKFSINKAGCQNYTIPWGAYHFFRSNYSGVLQAQHMVNIVGEGCNVYVCDVETMDGQSGATVIARVKNFLDTLYDLTGKKGVIYTSPGFWNPLPSPSWAKDYDLWDAAWYRNAPLLPWDWTTWKMWQYSAIGSTPGVPAATDLNEFNGDAYAVEEYFGNGEVQEPPDPEDYPLVSITAYILNIRKEANPTSQVMGTLPKNTVIAVTNEKIGTDGKLWYKSGDYYFASWWAEPL